MFTNYTPSQLSQAIIDTVQSSDKALTRLEICKAIGRKKSPHIIALIEGFVEDGTFKREEVLNRRNNREFLYSMAE